MCEVVAQAFRPALECFLMARSYALVIVVWLVELLALYAFQQYFS